VPIVVFGSAVVLKLVERFPVIIELGAAVLAFTAAKMVVGEPLLADLFGNARDTLTDSQTYKRCVLYVVAVVGVLVAGRWSQRRKAVHLAGPAGN
jgi:predicted tellurium resistance membrane protein TerC